MLKIVDDFGNVEKMLYMVAENQKFAKQKDNLTSLVEKFSVYTSEELSEEELDFVAAAKMPETPKYKNMKK